MSLLLLGAALPFGLRIEARRRGSTDTWWLSAPARLGATALAMVAWIYWCGTALEGADAAIAKLVGWLVLALEAAAHAGPTVPPATTGVTTLTRSRGPRPAVARCQACGAPLVTDRVPIARRQQRVAPRHRSRP